MKTTTNKIADIKAQINELRENKFNIELMPKLKELSSQLKKLEEVKAIEDLKTNIEAFNTSNKEANELFPKLKDFKGLILKTDGNHSKAFSEFLKSINTKLHIYARWYAGNKIEITLSDVKGNKFYYYFKDGELTYDVKDEINFNTVLKARKKHNLLIEKLDKLNAEIGKNYDVAMGNWGLLDHDNRKYKFYNI